MKNTNKRSLPLLMITALIAACSSNVNPVITSDKTSDYTANISKNNHTYLSAAEIKDFEKEYSQFTTESFSYSYLDKKLNKWLTESNDEKLKKELQFAQFKHPDLAHVFFNANAAKHTTMLAKSNIITQMNGDDPFAVFMGRGLAGNVTTLAGNGSGGRINATGTNATFLFPYGVAVDSAGNVFVSEQNDIRKITPAGVVTTFAGGGADGSTGGQAGVFANGNGTNATFSKPRGLAFDSAGNLYVADTYNFKIRKITTAGDVTTYAGDGGEFFYPSGVAVDSAGNVFVVDNSNNKIKKIDNTTNHVVTTIAGSTFGFADGNGTNAKFYNPDGIAIDSTGNLYVTDNANSSIRKITPAGDVTTLAGSTAGYNNGSFGFADATGTNALFGYPAGIAVDTAGNVYVGDSYNFRIRKITPAGVVTTVAGSVSSGVGGFFNGTNATFNVPTGVALDSTGKLYVADQQNNMIRKIQ